MSESDTLVGRGTIVGGEYQVSRPIARGTFAVIYGGVRCENGLPVIIKVLRGTASQEDHEAHERFRREAHIVSQLKHPNTVRMYDAGVTDDGHVYIVMERLYGHSLSEILYQEPLSVERVGNILFQVLGALDEAHQQSIVHRDLKPSNIMLCDPDRLGAASRGELDFVKLIDFGFVKLVKRSNNAFFERPITQTGTAVGTPGYIAPEMLEKGTVTPRADLYSIGIIAHELLCGKPAFKGTGLARAQAQLNDRLEKPPRPIRRHPLYTIIKRLIAKKPNNRYETAEKALIDLTHLYETGKLQKRKKEKENEPIPRSRLFFWRDR